MNIQALKAFVTTAESGSFSAAGRMLGKSQAAISKLIANLEVDLNGQLFDRSGRYPALTDLGLGIYERCRLLIEQETAIIQQAGMLQSGVENELKLGIDATANCSNLYTLLAELAISYPDLIIEIVESPMPQLVQQLLTGDLDLVLGPQLLQRMEGLSVLAGFSVHFEALCATTHSLSAASGVGLEDLKMELAVSYGQVRTMIDSSFRTSLRHWYVNSPESLASLVARGTGFGFVPAYLVPKLIERYNLVVLDLAPSIANTTWHYELLSSQSYLPQKVAQQIICHIDNWEF